MQKAPNIAEVSGPAREARIAELKAQYEAGKLRVDAEAVAAKVVESHVHDPMPPSDKV
jgi:anti-sigma28 factor (negative regulator of flagellin synthesis)